MQHLRDKRMSAVLEEGKRKSNQEFKNLKTDSLEDHCRRGGDGVGHEHALQYKEFQQERLTS